MPANIQVHTWLRDDGADAAIGALVQTWLRRRRQDLFVASDSRVDAGQTPFWPENFFGLQHVRAFQNAASTLQEKILWDCAYTVLGEALQIERAGIAYAAKMSLLAQSTMERQLYGVFVADEVAHLESLKPFAETRTLDENGPFLQLLSAVIEKGSRTCLQYIVQVVLEGWGLTHYRQLRDACANDALKSVFDRILSDEAAHHGSGVLLLDDGEMLHVHEGEILQWMKRFLAMVQMGPVSTLAVLEHHLGAMAPVQRCDTLVEMGATHHSETRLEVLRELMRKPIGGDALVAALESEGAFRPWSTTELI